MYSYLNMNNKGRSVLHPQKFLFYFSLSHSLNANSKIELIGFQQVSHKGVSKVGGGSYVNTRAL